MVTETEPLATGEYETYEKANYGQYYSDMYEPTKKSNLKKIVCWFFIGSVLALSAIGTIIYFTVIKEKHQINWVTNTTSKTTTTPISVTTPSTWSNWSRCSEECSSSLNTSDMKCPTKTRFRTKQGKREIETTDCNCVQCPFRYSEWYFDGCRGSHDCRKDSARYCQMVTPTGRVVHDSKTEQIYDKGLYKCQGSWKDMSYSHWNNYCGKNCSGSCKLIAIGCPWNNCKLQ